VSGTATWIAQLESQPWFTGVAQTFETMAPNVPTSVWEGELYVEDSSLSPTIEDYANSGHYGLFQEDAAFPTSVGLPTASTQQLQDPSYNAYVAAQAMEQAVQNNGAQTTTQIVTALQKAGWPGASPPAGDLQTRLAAVNAIASGQNPAPITPPSTSGSSTSTSGSDDSDWVSQVGTIVQSFAKNLLIGGVLLGVLAGGFYLLAASIGAPSVTATARM
jgi:hypothetical protein